MALPRPDRPIAPEEAILLAAIRSAPDDDAPRLVYADWLAERGDPRGELIVAQCAIARLPRGDRRRGELAGRVRQILDRCWHAWTGPLRLLPRTTLWRGFCREPLCVEAATLAAGRAALLRLSPTLFEHPERGLIGAWTTVYAGRQHGPRGAGDPAAIKRVHPAFARELIGPEPRQPASQVLIEREWRFGRVVDHPAVIRPVTRLCCPPREAAIALPWIDGPSLQELSHERGPLPPEVAAAIARQLCAGLSALHLAGDDRGQPYGIRLNNLRPDHVLLAPEGRAVIVDFGHARAAHPTLDLPSELDLTHLNTGPGLLKGKLAYFSPEQVRGRSTDHRTDLFSLGAVLSHLLVGRPPFRRETEFATLEAIVQGALPDGELDRMPSGLRHVVQRALQRDPEQRYQQASEMDADLGRACAAHGWRADREIVARFLAAGPRAAR